MAAFKLSKFTNPDRLRTIHPSRLITLLQPWREYLSGRGLAFPDAPGGELDCETLSKVLIQPSSQAPKGMVEALHYVHECASDEDMDELLEMALARKIDIEHDPTTTVADLAIQVWLAAPDLLREQHSRSVALRQKNFLYYAGSMGRARAFPQVEEAVKREVEAALDDWFEKHRRGRGCRTFFFPQGKNVWIIIQHGTHMRREASHGDDGQSSTEFYRPQQHDVLIYDTTADEIAVHADTKGEIRLYLACLGRFLFGREDYFPAADKFTLQPLLEKGSEALLCEDVPGLASIRLVEVRRYWGGAQREIEIRKATDVFRALGGRGRTLATGGRLDTAVFKVKFADARKERSVSIRPPGNAKYERNEDSELIEVWLKKRKFILKPAAENDDEEAPSAVLESA